MNHNVAQEVSDKVGYLATQTSGGRLRFSTDSSVIGISVKYPSLHPMSNMPLTGSCGFALVEKTGDIYKTVAIFRPQPDEKNGYTGEVKIKSQGRHEYILFFPLYNAVSELNIYLDESAKLYEPEEYRDIAPILYYGASIDQGACASRPDCCYPAMLSKWNDIDYINLGFSGNCKGEPLMAEYLSGIDCSLFFMAYDGNVSVEHLERTHFRFYEIYRQAKKDVPVIFMSARDKEFDRIIGLEKGSDDYITKPFSPKELVLRVNNIMRRTYKDETQKVMVDGYEIDETQRIVVENGVPIELTTKEFDLLMLFVNNRGTAFPRDQILENVWEENYFGSDRVVDDTLRRLRKKMPNLSIHTIYGFGYRLG
jgi:two-component system response regulator CssR